MQHSVGTGTLGRRLDSERKLQAATRHTDRCTWYTVLCNNCFRIGNQEQ